MPGLPWMAATRRVIRMVTGAMIITMLPFMSRARAGKDEVSRSAVSDRPGKAGPIYLHRVVMRYELGEGPRSYWLFEPPSRNRNAPRSLCSSMVGSPSIRPFMEHGSIISFVLVVP